MKKKEEKDLELLENIASKSLLPGGVFIQLKGAKEVGEKIDSKKKLTGGMLKKPKKASLGALIGIGADSLLKNSETARSLTKNLGIGGKLLGSYYDKKADSKDKTTGAEQTKQIIAKQMGGMVRGGRAEIKGTRPAKLS